MASSGLVELQNRTRAGLEYAVSQQTVSGEITNLKKLIATKEALLKVEIIANVASI